MSGTASIAVPVPVKEFSWLNRSGVAIAEMPIAGEIPALLPEERECVASAVPARVREFSAGRACARQAMTMLGLPKEAIPAGPDRVPRWPRGVSGSITHSRTHCAAAVILQGRGLVSIGIDLEPSEDLCDELVSSVCRPEEADWIARQASSRPLLLARVIFSAKESVYKALHSIAREPLEFEDLSVELSTSEGAFEATLRKPLRQFPARLRIGGQFHISPSHISTAVLLSEDHVLPRRHSAALA